jgi:predicted nucleotidyltransferase
VDYSKPVEAVIPGVQGRVLGLLARTDAELTMRTVARLAGVSVNRAAAVLNHLVALGLVERREAGAAALVRLARDNEAAKAILVLEGVRESVLARLRSEAQAIHPAPASLVVFGSFARDEAGLQSDLDVLVVPPPEVTDDDPGWLDAIGHWTDRAARIAGNPVNLLVARADELPKLLRRRRTVWEEIARDGIVLAGLGVHELAAVA